MSLVVLKLGGSLLLRPELPDRLARLLSELSGSRILIVVGGGTAADVVRSWSDIHGLSDESAHWLAIQSLRLTSALIQSLIPELRNVTAPVEGNRFWQESNAPLILNVDTFLRKTEPTDAFPLPHNWHVTSDSIAAWAAARWGADELLLLKSIDLDPGISLVAACRAGLVDDHFPQIAAQVPRISWCNLARDGIARSVWLEAGQPVTQTARAD